MPQPVHSAKSISISKSTRSPTIPKCQYATSRAEGAYTWFTAFSVLDAVRDGTSFSSRIQSANGIAELASNPGFGDRTLSRRWPKNGEPHGCRTLRNVAPRRPEASDLEKHTSLSLSLSEG
jgi:hypothetical protein